MIILFHSLWFVGRFVYNIVFDKILANRYINEVYVPLEHRNFELKNYVFSKQCVRELKGRQVQCGSTICKFDEEAGLRFIPPVYCQRYSAIKEEMSKEVWRGKLKKVLDVGCAELSFFPFLKNFPGVEEILALDIDVDLLETVAHRAGPLLADHLTCRLTPLHVLVLGGSIATPDPRLLGCDVVIAIELIEHLYPGELDEVPFTVFGYIRPSLVLITTPNSDFNVLFGHRCGFRHPDHKFEWSRLQFQDWAMNIVERYPDYEVTFRGIGTGPNGSEHFGACSQMAIFTKNDVQDLDSCHEGLMMSKNDRVLGPVDELKIQENYSVIAEYQYPVYVETRTERQIIKDNVSCFISNYGSRTTHERKRLYMEYEETGYYPDEDYDEDILVPFEDIMGSLDQKQLTEEELREILEECNWDLEMNEGRLVVNYTKYENQNFSPIPDEEEEESKWDPSEKAEVEELDWDGNDKNDFCRTTQNVSPVPSCASDWNEDDTQTKAFVDSGYPNSFSAQDKDFANSVDLHGSSLEEDSEDDMEEDLENGVAQDNENLQDIQLVQNENMDNMPLVNVAPIQDLFYEVQGNQDENQDVVNNNCDNEGNNAEAEVFVLDDGPEVGGVNAEEGSESEVDDQEPPSEEDTDLEGEQVGMEEEEELVERLLQQVHVNNVRPIPRREEVSLDAPVNRQLPDLNQYAGPVAAGDYQQRLPVLPVVDLDNDEGFADGLAGPAIAVAPVDEGGAGEPCPF